MPDTSWVLLEVGENGGEKSLKALAGTEDRKAAIRMLASLKQFHDECLRSGKPSNTIIHSSVEIEADNPLVAETIEEQENTIDQIFNMVQDELASSSN